MIEFTPLNIKEQSVKIDQEFSKITSLDPFLDLELILNSKHEECKEIINKKLNDYLVLYDDGLKLVIRIHELFKNNNLKTKTGFSFVVLTSKMISALIGIRKMILSGLPDCIKNLNRPLIETIDVCYACLGNKEFSDSFGQTTKMYDNNKFYHDNLKRGGLRRKCNELFIKIPLEEYYIEYLNQRRKDQNSFLSNSIHSSFNASFSNYWVFTLDFEFSDDYYGKVTTAYPKMLMSLLEEIFILNNVLYYTLERKVSPDLQHIEISNIDPLYLHSYKKFDTLYIHNVNQLSEQSELHHDFIKDMQKYASENGMD